MTFFVLLIVQQSWSLKKKESKLSQRKETKHDSMDEKIYNLRNKNICFDIDIL